ncbi:hypothetical protein KFE25_000074 [Diacronema lutheri]|uniref:E3 ubiquitin-protein ligase n=1 Tax=Diacronema lutheri TaxID=2081491 RepID=A0A8J5XEZ3_DIALT|nr:hypothetical protein KFE25_000074 [Diacronema lutheri]
MELSLAALPSSAYAESLLREGGLPRLRAALAHELAEGDAQQLPKWLDLVLCARALPDGGEPRALLESLGNARQEQRCSYVFKSGDIAWNCRTCQVDSTCVQCMECFRNASHEGHEITFHRTARGGCCDCGDEEAWSPAGFCSRHSGARASAACQPCAELPAPLSATWPLLIDDVLALLRKTIARAVGSFHPAEVPPQPAAADERVGGEGGVAESATRDDWGMPWDPQPVASASAAAAAVAAAAESGARAGGCAGGAVNVGASAGAGGSGSVMVVLHNTDVHTFEEVASALMAIGCAREWAYELTHLIDRTGESVVAIAPAADALHKWTVLHGATLLVSLTDKAQRAREARAEAAVHWLCHICELSDAATTSLGEALTAAPAAAELFFRRVRGRASGRARERPMGAAEPSAAAVSRAAAGCGASAAAAPPAPTSTPSHRPAAVAAAAEAAAAATEAAAAAAIAAATAAVAPQPSVDGWSLLQAALANDALLPRPLQRALHALFLKLIGEPRLKLGFARAFCGAYRHLAGQYARGVGTSEDSALSFSVQLFTAPSVVVALCREGLVQMLLEALRDALDCAAGGPAPRRVIDCGSACVRRNRYSPILRDLEYALSIRHVAAHVALAADRAERAELSDAACDALGYASDAAEPLLRAFMRELARTQGADPHARRTVEHVTFESRAWIWAFHLGMALGNTSSILVGYALGTDANSAAAVRANAFATEVRGGGGDGGGMSAGAVAERARAGAGAGTGADAVRADADADADADAVAEDCAAVARSFARAAGVEVRAWLASRAAAPTRRLVRRLPGSAAALAARGADGGGRGGPSARAASSDDESDRSSDDGGGGPASDGDGDDDAQATQGTPGALRPPRRRALRGLDLCLWRDPVSIHWALHRHFATVIGECARADGGSARAGLLRSLLDAALDSTAGGGGVGGGGGAARALLAGLVEYPLLALAHCAQVLVGMWRRNGNSILSQATNYAKVMPWCMRLRDRDVLLLQYGMAHGRASDVLERAVHRFGLWPWLSVAPLSLPTGAAASRAWPVRATWAPEHAAALTCELLSLLVSCATEMPPPAGADAERTWLRRELVHRLAAQPATRSELSDWFQHFKLASVGGACGSTGLNDSLVDEVARPTAGAGAAGGAGAGAAALAAAGAGAATAVGAGTEPPRLELRAELWASFDPQFWHLTPSELRSAVERQPRPPPCDPARPLGAPARPIAPPPPRCHPFFAPARRALLTQPPLPFLCAALLARTLAAAGAAGAAGGADATAGGEGSGGGCGDAPWSAGAAGAHVSARRSTPPARPSTSDAAAAWLAVGWQTEGLLALVVHLLTLGVHVAADDDADGEEYADAGGVVGGAGAREAERTAAREAFFRLLLEPHPTLRAAPVARGADAPASPPHGSVVDGLVRALAAARDALASGAMPPAPATLSGLCWLLRALHDRSPSVRAALDVSGALGARGGAGGAPADAACGAASASAGSGAGAGAGGAATDGGDERAARREAARAARERALRDMAAGRTAFLAASAPAPGARDAQGGACATEPGAIGRVGGPARACAADAAGSSSVPASPALAFTPAGAGSADTLVIDNDDDDDAEEGEEGEDALPLCIICHTPDARTAASGQDGDESARVDGADGGADDGGDGEALDVDARLLLMAYVQPSAALVCAADQWGGRGFREVAGERYSAGVHVRACGHAVHRGCFARHSANLRARDDVEPLIDGRSAVDISRGEFLCPLCRRPCNALLPVLRARADASARAVADADAGAQPANTAAAALADWLETRAPVALSVANDGAPRLGALDAGAARRAPRALGALALRLGALAALDPPLFQPTADPLGDGEVPRRAARAPTTGAPLLGAADAPPRVGARAGDAARVTAGADGGGRAGDDGGGRRASEAPLTPAEVAGVVCGAIAFTLAADQLAADTIARRIGARAPAVPPSAALRALALCAAHARAEFESDGAYDGAVLSPLRALLALGVAPDSSHVDEEEGARLRRLHAPDASESLSAASRTVTVGLAHTAERLAAAATAAALDDDDDDDAGARTVAAAVAARAAHTLAHGADGAGGAAIAVPSAQAERAARPLLGLRVLRGPLLRADMGELLVRALCACPTLADAVECARALCCAALAHALIPTPAAAAARAALSGAPSAANGQGGTMAVASHMEAGASVGADALAALRRLRALLGETPGAGGMTVAQAARAAGNHARDDDAGDDDDDARSLGAVAEVVALLLRRALTLLRALAESTAQRPHGGPAQLRALGVRVNDGGGPDGAADRLASGGAAAVALEEMQRLLGAPTAVELAADARMLCTLRTWVRAYTPSATADNLPREAADALLGVYRPGGAAAARRAALLESPARGLTPHRPPRVQQLVQLAPSFTEEYALQSSRLCSRCHCWPDEPAVCLCCGALLCAGSACCRVRGVGELTLHARTCGHGVGIFFLLHRCVALLIRGSRAAYAPSPYVDAHGDEDPMLKRGKPLFLHAGRMAQLEALWLTHGVAAEIVRVINTSERVIRNNYY